jgi:hypothetical protein
MLLGEIIFILVSAFAIAKLEIQIEGKDGWAKNLPTWKIKNRLTKLLIGSYPFTGYHLWAGITLFVFFHLPFFIGLPWNLSNELKLISMLIVTVVLEDFLWFILNPNYGIKKFNSKFVSWHKWIGPLPLAYAITLPLGITLFLLIPA